MKFSSNFIYKLLGIIFLIQVAAIVSPSSIRSESLPSNNKGKMFKNAETIITGQETISGEFPD